MDQIIQQFLASFEWSMHSGSVHPQCQMIDQLAAEGKTDILYELGVALDAHAERLQVGGVESVYNHLERVLALTPGMIYAHTLMKLSLLPRTRTMRFPWSLDQRSRGLAPLLASAQSTSVLLDLIEAHRQNQAYTEFICILVQEMVLRGIRCDEIPLIVDFFDQMRRVDHPLAWLPLRLLEIENGLPLSSYTVAVTYFASAHIEGPDSAEEEAPSYPGEGLRVALVESTTDFERDRILAVVDPWSNARLEARTFTFDHSIASWHVSGSLLLSMNLACLKGVNILDIFLGPRSRQNAFRLLFAAASSGGAYENGHEGAYGRLATWCTLAGLVGAPEHISVEEVASLIEQSRWFSFSANSDWFYWAAPMWDLGMLTLRPDGRSLAVLAATSTSQGGA